MVFGSSSLHMDPHMDAYPPGGEDVSLPAGRVLRGLVAGLSNPVGGLVTQSMV